MKAKKMFTDDSTYLGINSTNEKDIYTRINVSGENSANPFATCDQLINIHHEPDYFT